MENELQLETNANAPPRAKVIGSIRECRREVAESSAEVPTEMAKPRTAHGESGRLPWAAEITVVGVWT